MTMLRFLAVHMAVGVAAGWVVLAAFFALDVANLRTLTMGSPSAPLVILLMMVFFAITFGSFGMGFAIMSPPSKDDSASAGGRKDDDRPLFAEPARIRVRARR